MLHEGLGYGNVGLNGEEVLVGVVKRYPGGCAAVVLPPLQVSIQAVIQGSHLVFQSKMFGMAREGGREGGRRPGERGGR